ncbi:UDP-N-acetylmuramoyl-L-alanine--D-glutamate ligase [candidate division Kazan bacterium]|uniref:UDP-N-acetylmuramoylalanine--D-glutamate ligase n=1 Tax=candidate division Kazan bacterium TaxID=2202143 RepID=A0A420ZCU0_UNCK3|nr:MAG: UDP-N-acetylmuramoyl-L-alanine--D-glutamate ligase [candidate division Kazan bacterium]
MTNSELKGRRVAVLGLGKEGLDLVRFLCRQGASVTVLDQNTAAQLGNNYKQAKKFGAKFKLGDMHLDGLEIFEIIFRSPGVPLQLPEIKKAKRAGVKISSAIKLFFDLCPAKIVAVTGTKGKSTTASLIYHLLKGGRSRVFLAGNIGKPPLALIGRLQRKDTVVLELSSFQLEDLHKSPQIAVWLNVVPEHLDRHKNFSSYLAAKKNIIKHQRGQDWLIVSRDFAGSRKSLKDAKGKVFIYSLNKVLKRGLYIAKGDIVYRTLDSGKRQVVTKVSDITLKGKHNLQNVLSAIAVAVLSGVSLKQIARKLTAFKPLEHRLELAREIGDVIFINDSLGTTPEAAAAAAQAFAYRDTAMIVGGVYKGGDIVKMAKDMAKHGVKFVALIGKSASKFERIFKRHAPDVATKKFSTFKSAIKEAYNQVRTNGGVVILSPACASFDMFKNAYKRGKEFKDIVKSL